MYSIECHVFCTEELLVRDGALYVARTVALKVALRHVVTQSECGLPVGWLCHQLACI